MAGKGNAKRPIPELPKLIPLAPSAAGTSIALAAQADRMALIEANEASLVQALTNLSLPDTNGNFDIGISAGVDPSLDDSDKLHVYPEFATRRRAAVESATWAYKRFDKTTMERDLCTRAAFMIVMTDTCRHHDGDSVTHYADTAIERTIREDVIKLLNDSPDLMINAMTMVIGTKVSWWLTNHHTGGRVANGFAAKLIGLYMVGNAMRDEEKVTVLHRIGHWASTCAALECVFPMIVKRHPSYFVDVTDEDGTVLADYPAYKLTMSRDLTMRFESYPAGTHRHAVSYSAICKLEASPLFAMCPSLIELAHVKNRAIRIKENKHLYHIGSRYFLEDSSNIPEFDDNEASGVLGRLCTFISCFYSKSTLYASPHLSKPGVSATIRVSKETDFEDYNASWAQLCKVAKNAMSAKPPKELTDKIAKLVGAFNKNVKHQLMDYFDHQGAPMTSNEMQKRIQEAVQNAEKFTSKADKKESESPPAVAAKKSKKTDEESAAESETDETEDTAE